MAYSNGLEWKKPERSFFIHSSGREGTLHCQWLCWQAFDSAGEGGDLMCFEKELAGSGVEFVRKISREFASAENVIMLRAVALH